MDAFGHRHLTGTASYLAALVSHEEGCKTRGIELSTLQRSASHMASRVDINEAFMVGGAAVKAADEGCLLYTSSFVLCIPAGIKAPFHTLQYEARSAGGRQPLSAEGLHGVDLDFNAAAVCHIGRSARHQPAVDHGADAETAGSIIRIAAEL